MVIMLLSSWDFLTLVSQASFIIHQLPFKFIDLPPKSQDLILPFLVGGTFGHHPLGHLALVSHCVWVVTHGPSISFPYLSWILISFRFIPIFCIIRSWKVRLIFSWIVHQGPLCNGFGFGGFPPTCGWDWGFAPCMVILIFGALRGISDLYLYLVLLSGVCLDPFEYSPWFSVAFRTDNNNCSVYNIMIK